MAATDTIHRLVETFDKNIFDYKNSAYKEAHVRQEFINPFWKALGWDMSNRAGHPMHLREVIHEDSIEIDGNKKAPDYGFRKAGQTKFYLEVKAPRVYLKDDLSPAFQIKSYAWSGGLQVSVLSDFEEFAIYQCTNKPNATDKPIKDRIAYFKYTEYIEKWDWLYEKFSKEAVYDGRFDTFANTYAKKRGTQSFDKAFLADMHEWRTKLAQNIALRNPWIDEKELNYAVQTTLDRIIFLRIAEDRGIEKYGNLGVDAGLDYVLEAKSTKKRKVEGVYQTLLKRFKYADDRFNSGLFHFSKEKERGAHDTLTPRLEIDDKVITKIIEQLYYPESPYAFDQVPADVLGSVYEQFLGQVITLSPSHKASIDYKPEVKKAGGVYYTPKYIVDYIVKNTLGKLLDDVWQPRGTGVPPVTPVSGNLSLRGGTTKQSPEEQHTLSTTDLTKLHKRASALTILDPACGSGSFLLGAYQFLLDWYHRFYTETDPTYWEKQKKIELINSPSPEKGRAGVGLVSDTTNPEEHHTLAPKDYRLTLAERKRILLTHIHGVDIDSQAVEVAKLNLLLKASEGGNTQAQQQAIYDRSQRLLPDLEKNIVCGNSLVEWDITKMMKLTREDEERIKPFDFKQAFPDIMKAGGFDVVIGNPPYVRQEGLSEFKDYFEKHFSAYHGSADLYTYFIERGVSLLDAKGLFSYIVNNKWMRANYGEPMRGWLKTKEVIEIVDFNDLQVFNGATTYPCILTIGAGGHSENFRVCNVSTLDFEQLEDLVSRDSFEVKSSDLANTGWTLTPKGRSDLHARLRANFKTLSDVVGGAFYRGIVTGNNDAFVIDAETRARIVAEDPKSAEVIKPYLAGREVKRYDTPETDRYLIFTRRGTDINKYPAIKKYLTKFKSQLMPRPIDHKGQWEGRKPGSYKWFEIQDSIDYHSEFEKARIIVPAIVQRASYAFTDQPLYSNDKTSIIRCDDLAILGVLNSKVADFFVHAIASTKQGGYFEYKPMYIGQVPIPSFTKDQRGKLASLVRDTLEVGKTMYRNPSEQVKRKFEFLNEEIDRLVYELYGLSEEEIRIVEVSA